MAEVRQAILALIEERRKNPSTDLMSQLIQMRDGTDKLSADELFAQMFTLLAAALQSTASALGGILLTMCRHPDQFALVKAERALVPSAVDESSEESRVGKECVSTCRSRWAPYHKKKKKKQIAVRKRYT